MSCVSESLIFGLEIDRSSIHFAAGLRCGRRTKEKIISSSESLCGHGAPSTQAPERDAWHIGHCNCRPDADPINDPIFHSVGRSSSG
jgi:hypothetical protein